MSKRQKELFDPGKKTLSKETIQMWRDSLDPSWRKPDVYDSASGYVHAIWYGFDGRDGDVATEITVTDDTVEVSEYQHVGAATGEPEEHWPDRDNPFGKVTTAFESDVALETLKLFGIKPRSKRDIVGYFVSLGVAQILYWGGQEEYVDALP